jgi:hypothetical protein
VAFTDSEGITHSVQVAASSLFEAAALGIAQFRQCRFAEALIGPGTRLTISVETPATAHQLTFAKLSAWLDGGGRSPAEQATKIRLKQLLA